MGLIDKVKIKAGRLVRVWNKNPRPNANKKYTCLWVEDADGSNERPYLFTDHELKRAETRAERNKEDLTKKSWLTDLLD